jgi:hypothetical protein
MSSMLPQSKSFAAWGRGLTAVVWLVTSLARTAQGQERRFHSASTPAGSEMERYLRAADLIDSSSRKQWTIRPSLVTEPGSFTFAYGHPWRAQFPDSSPVARIGLTEPSLSLFWNSDFPYGFNDGPVWAGRGLTVAASAGAELIRPHISVTLAPVAFIAQNREFAVGDNGLAEDRRFADLQRPDAIDLPQRFGAKSYAAFNPGESEIALRGIGLTGGVSSRSQIWGPAYEHPLILGNNAGGIPRVFAGTETPLDLRWITVHGQIIWGQLNESSYGRDTGSMRRHFATAAVGTIGIKRVPGLELGAARFFHTAMPEGGFLHGPWLRLLQGLFNDNPGGPVQDNQLASAFMRLALPGSGFEIYGEIAKEDRQEYLRSLLLEPDHEFGYLLGFARAWATQDRSRTTVLRGELLNTSLSHILQTHVQTPMYMHVAQSQGHTEHGQLLASAGGYGGGASNLVLDRYSTKGRTTLRWDRVVRGTPRVNGNDIPIPDRMDVTHAVGLERALFTKGGQLTIGGTLVKNFNRYFSDDAVNANVAVKYRVLHSRR